MQQNIFKDAACFDDVLQTLCEQRQSGLLTISQASIDGQVYLDKGIPWAAQVSNEGNIWLHGASAIYYIANWTEAVYRFDDEASRPAERSIFLSYHDLQIASIFEREEWQGWQPGEILNDITPVVPVNLEDNLVVSNAADRPLYQLLPYTLGTDSQSLSKVELTPNNWSVLMHANGQTTVEQIAVKTKLPLEVVVETVYALVQHGLLGLNPGNTSARPSSPALPAIFTNRQVANQAYNLGGAMG